MSFNYPTLHAKGSKDTSGLGNHLDQTPVNLHGLSDALHSGLSAVTRKPAEAHPLEMSERYHNTQENQINYAMLRATQGIHAPLRLQMEKFLVQQSFRHSVLPTSNLHLDVLNGKDETIDFEDVLNVPEYWEKEMQPNLFLEKKTDSM